MLASHILQFFQKSEFPFGIISLHPEEPIEQVLWWQILSLVFSKCLYYTPVVYRDLVCQRFRQFICRLGIPFCGSSFLHLPLFSTYCDHPFVSFECLNQQICSFLSEFQLSNWHQLKESRKLTQKKPFF